MQTSKADVICRYISVSQSTFGAVQPTEAGRPRVAREPDGGGEDGVPALQRKVLPLLQRPLAGVLGRRGDY